MTTEAAPVRRPRAGREPRAGRLRDHPQFLAVLTGQTLSQLGDYAFRIALPLETLRLTGNGRLLSAVLLAQSVSLVVAALAGGVLADRLGSRRLMLAADLGRGAVVAAAAAAIGTGRSTPLMLVGLGLCLGIGQGLFQPAYQAAVPELVPLERVPDAARAGALWRRVASLAGVPVGGALVAALGTAWGFVLNGTTFVVAALCIVVTRSWPEDLLLSRDRSARKSPVNDFAAGLRYLRARRELQLPIAAFAVAIMTTFSPLFVVLPLLSANGDDTAARLSVVLTIAAIGGVLGSTAYGRLWRTASRGRLAMSALAVAAASYAAVGLTHPRIVLMGAAALVAGAATSVGDIAWGSALQQHVPREFLGRVSSVDWVASYGLAPVGYALVPLALMAVPPRTVLIAGGLLTAAVAVAIRSTAAVRGLE